jgi:replicative DNA helicase
MPPRDRDNWLPHNDEAEQAVIGSVLKDPNSISLVADLDPAATFASREGARAPDVLNRVQSLFESLEIVDARDGLVAPEQWGHILVDDYEARANGGRTFSTTGLLDVDRMIGGGFADGTLNLVMGVTGLGKTEFAFQVALHVQRAHGAVVYGSLEMGADELGHRAARVLRDLDRNQLAHGTLSEEQRSTLLEVANMLNIGRLWPVTPSREYRVRDLRRHALRVQAQTGHVRMIVLDYLQRLDDTSDVKNSSREQDVAMMAKRLKDLAIELHCPVVALVQPNDDYLTRPDKHPIISDVRESRRLSHEADVMLGLYREEYFNANCPDSQQGIMEVTLLKNRSGVGMAPGALSRIVWSGSRYRDLFEEERAMQGALASHAQVTRQPRRRQMPAHRPTPRQEQEHAAREGGLPF